MLKILCLFQSLQLSIYSYGYIHLHLMSLKTLFLLQKLLRFLHWIPSKLKARLSRLNTLNTQLCLNLSWIFSHTFLPSLLLTLKRLILIFTFMQMSSFETWSAMGMWSSIWCLRCLNGYGLLLNINPCNDSEPLSFQSQGLINFFKQVWYFFLLHSFFLVHQWALSLDHWVSLVIFRRTHFDPDITIADAVSIAPASY